ncbi:MAG TPA: hypothetical protein PK228_17165, partial [Saprospiraceae bacterium]|nr:hypothetical protein [Saprospiraceae bacterium]
KQYTYPEVWLTPVVDQVRLRPSPGVTDQFIIHMEGEKKWTGKISEHQDTIPIRGKEQPFPWLEVVTGYPHGAPFSWVYEGCVRPLCFDFKMEHGLDTVVENRWIRLEPITAGIFNTVLKRAGRDTLIRWIDLTAQHPTDSTPVRLVINGKSKIYRDHLSDGESHVDHTYVAEKDGWHVINISGWEYGNFLLVRKSDGLECNTKGASQYIPLPSPGHKRWAFPSGQTYGFGEGLEVFDLNAQRSFVVNIGLIKNLVWENEGTILFELRNSSLLPPKCYRLSFQNILD